MAILIWDKPEKTQSTEDWKNANGFDGGPAGGYVPNMSSNDAKKWRAKLVGKTTSSPQVEIRKQISGSANSFDGPMLLLIINLGGGYKYKGFVRAGENPTNEWRKGRETGGVNIHMALNGGAQMTFQDMEDMQAAIAEAKAYLEALK